MSSIFRAIAKVVFMALVLAAVVRPASATISYTSCSSGCSSTSGTYAVWQTAPGSAGLTFSMSPATFAGGNLASGVYIDPTGAVFTGYSGATIDTQMSVSGGSLVEGNNGTGTGIEIQLPANTYAFAMNITTVSGFGNPSVAIGDHNVSSSNYNILIPTGGSVQFFAITSDTPLTELFLGPTSSSGRLQINNFELGQAAPTGEVSTLALIGSGLVLLGVLRRRRIHKPDGALA